MSERYLVLVTAGSMEAAEKIAHALVEEHLAACVNIVPQIRSIYRWEGKVVDDSEVLMIIKTREERFEALREKVVELHSYDVPEIISFTIGKAHQPYLDWLDDETG